MLKIQVVVKKFAYFILGFFLVKISVQILALLSSYSTVNIYCFLRNSYIPTFSKTTANFLHILKGQESLVRISSGQRIYRLLNFCQSLCTKSACKTIIRNLFQIQIKKVVNGFIKKWQDLGCLPNHAITDLLDAKFEGRIKWQHHTNYQFSK